MSAGLWLAVAAGVLAGATAFAFLVWLGIGWLGAHRLNRAPEPGPRREFTFTPLETGVDHEAVRFPATDGVELFGWFLPRPETRRVAVAMHGYRGEMSQVLGISSQLWRAGWNVLLFDFRGRGRSAPAPISMGAWETADLVGALGWIEDRVPDPRVALFGFSMGGVVGLLSGEDRRVAAVIADSAFANQREMLGHLAASDARRFLPGRIDGRRFLPAMEWWHRRMGKPGFDEIAPVEAMAELDGTPVMLVHGGRDRYVAREHAERLHGAARGPSESWWVEDALHCGAYFVDRDAYMERVTRFLDRHVPEETA